MSRTQINVGAVIDATSQINAAKTSASSAKSSFTQTKNSIDGKIQNRSNIRSRLSTVQTQLSNIDSQIGKIRSVVQGGANLYHSTDTKVESWKDEISNVVGAQKVGQIASTWASYFDDPQGIKAVVEKVIEQAAAKTNAVEKTDVDQKVEEKQATPLGEQKSSLENFLSKAKPYAIASIVNMVSPVGGLLYVTSGLYKGNNLSVKDPAREASATADAEWLGYETEDDHPGITAWLGKASAQAQNEWGYAGVNAYLGKAKAEADADFSFMETTKTKEYIDGKWVEKTSTEFINAEISAGASVSVLAADAKAGVGNDMLGAEIEAQGSAGTAKAEAKAKFSVSDDGVDANVSGSAMVAAVEGEAKGTINILGIEITGKIGGYAGAAGVEGKIGMENNKFVMEGGVAALLGVSGGIEIGFNDEGWDNFVDFVTFWD